MSTQSDRYSDDRKIVLNNGSGTYTVDGSLVVTGDAEVAGDLDITGSITAPEIITSFGSLDLTSAKNYRYHIPMAYIKTLIDAGFGSATFTSPFEEHPDTTTADYSTNYIGRHTFPLIRFDTNNQYIVIPVHEFVKYGTVNGIVLSCETVVAEVFVSSPVTATWQKFKKSGTTAMETGEGMFAAEATFLNDTRRLLFVSMTNVTFDSTTDLLLIKISRNYASSNTMIVFSVELIVSNSIYELIGK